MRPIVLTLGLLWAAVAYAQAIEVSAGTSTLFNAAGGGVNVYFPTQTMSLFGGVAANSPVIGVSDSFSYDGYHVTLGDKVQGFSFDGTGLSTVNRGITIERGSDSEQLTAFVGSTGLAYYEPFFQAADTRHFGAGLFGRKRIYGLEFSSLEVISGDKRTAAQGFAYRRKIFRLQGSGGVLNSARFLNGLLELQPAQWIHFTAAHQSYFWPTRSTFDSASAFSSFAHLSLQASVLDGKAQGQQLIGETVGAGAHFPGFSEISVLYTSRQQRFTTHTVTESLRRITFSQVVTTSSGKTNVSFGGSILTNTLSLSVSHSIMFFAVQGFQNVTTVQISLRVPHTDAAVNLAGNFGPQGVPKYTISGADYFYGHSGLFSGNEQPRSIGKYSVCGAVKEQSGEPVSGAALRIGKAVVYTDSEGKFTLRSRKRGKQKLFVVTAEFELGSWEVLDAPAFITIEDSGAPVQITVRRISE
jgi:hypothetical protein